MSDVRIIAAPKTCDVCGDGLYDSSNHFFHSSAFYEKMGTFFGLEILIKVILEKIIPTPKLNRYRRKRPKVDATIFASVLSHTRRSDASEKKKKIARSLLEVFACRQVSSPRLYRLTDGKLTSGSLPD